MAIGDAISSGISSIGEIVAENPLASLGVAGAAGAAVGAAGGAIVGSKIAKRKKRSKKSKKKHSKRKSKGRKLKFGSKAYRKKYLHKKRRSGHTKRTSHKRIRMTKKGQPYVILSNGRARFIKRSSARRSRKLKGGRY